MRWATRCANSARSKHAVLELVLRRSKQDFHSLPQPGPRGWTEPGGRSAPGTAPGQDLRTVLARCRMPTSNRDHRAAASRPTVDVQAPNLLARLTSSAKAPSICRRDDRPLPHRSRIGAAEGLSVIADGRVGSAVAALATVLQRNFRGTREWVVGGGVRAHAPLPLFRAFA